MDKVFVLMKVGVYKHDIFGVFDLVSAAINAADMLATAEADSYHRLVVYEVPYNRIEGVLFNKDTFFGTDQYRPDIEVYSVHKEEQND